MSRIPEHGADSSYSRVAPEEVELRSLQPAFPDLHSIVHGCEGRDIPGLSPDLNAHNVQYSSSKLHDRDPLLQDDTGDTATSQDFKKNLKRSRAQGPMGSWNRAYTSSTAPLHRGRTCLSDRIQRSRFHGWRMGVLLGCLTSSLVLCCNVAMLVIGAKRNGGYISGVADLIYSDEVTTARWNTGIHVLINILGTCLLAGTNYTMQVTSSPTRREIDAAHVNGVWLAVGLLSPHNWKQIERKRVLTALVLGLSSVPLHLFYNATIFRVVVRHTYQQRAVRFESDEFATLSSNVTYVSLTNDQWKSEFIAWTTPSYADLALVYDDTNYTSTQPQRDSFMLDWVNSTGGYQYKLSEMILDSDWLVQGGQYDQPPVQLHIVHAFARRARLQTRLQLSLHYLAVVIAANVFKLFIMLSVLLADHGHNKYIVTLGDAAASFLSSPDPATEGTCLMKDEKIWSQIEASAEVPKIEVNNADDGNSLNSLTDLGVGGWHVRTLAYFTLVRNEQSRFAFFAILGMFSIVIGFMTTTTGKAWTWGTSSDGALSFSSDKPSASATLFNAWIANVPQLLLSFSYLSLNSFCTAMSSAEEWNNLGSARKGLRVSEPRGHQRSTYFLQLPYRWSLPLMFFSTALHWLLSQTFFLVRIDVFTTYGSRDYRDSSGSRSACGVSASSFIVFFVAFLALCITVRSLASRKIVTGLPQAASNSLIISAACHPPKDEIDPHLKAVQWGVVEVQVVDGYGHCALSSQPLTAPEEGKMYY